MAWNGRKRSYDLLKEVTVSGLVVAVLAVALSLLFASPDPVPVTFKEWVTQGTKDFARTTLSEIDGTSLSATYGPPYQTTAQNGSTQGFGPLSPEVWFGEAIPIDTWQQFVVAPLRTLGDPKVDAAIDKWDSADSVTRASWAKATRQALDSADARDGTLTLADGPNSGPLPVLLTAQTEMARTGALDAALLYTSAVNLSGSSVWYSNDQTKALLYFGDSGDGGAGADCISAGQPASSDGSCWYYNLSVDNSAPRFGGYLAGNTFGIINEVGNWPGAWWLFPYSVWYQFGPGITSPSADLYAMIMTALVSLPFLALPFIPILRDIPKATRIYRIMWSDYYRELREEVT